MLADVESIDPEFYQSLKWIAYVLPALNALFPD